MLHHLQMQSEVNFLGRLSPLPNLVKLLGIGIPLRGALALSMSLWLIVLFGHFPSPCGSQVSSCFVYEFMVNSFAWPIFLLHADHSSQSYGHYKCWGLRKIEVESAGSIYPWG